MTDLLDSITSAKVAPGELLLWTGKPRAGIRFSRGDLWTIPFALILCGFSGFQEWSAVSRRFPLATQLFWVPVIAIGLHLLAGRFLIEAFRRSNTSYAVTTERIIIITGFIFRRTESLSLRTLGETSITERDDGSGSILLGPVQLPSGEHSVRIDPPTLDSIEEVRNVYELILANRKQS